MDGSVLNDDSERPSRGSSTQANQARSSLPQPTAVAYAACLPWWTLTRVLEVIPKSFLWIQSIFALTAKCERASFSCQCCRQHTERDERNDRMWGTAECYRDGDLKDGTIEKFFISSGCNRSLCWSLHCWNNPGVVPSAAFCAQPSVDSIQRVFASRKCPIRRFHGVRGVVLITNISHIYL